MVVRLPIWHRRAMPYGHADHPCHDNGAIVEAVLVGAVHTVVYVERMPAWASQHGTGRGPPVWQS